MTAEQFQVRESVDAIQWDAQVSALGGSLHHCSMYARYVTAADANAVPCFMSLDGGDGGPVGVALGFRARSGRKVLAPLTGRLRLAAMPVVRDADENLLLEFLRRLEGYARKARDVELEVGSSASFHGGGQLERRGFALTRRFEFELDLSASEDELWKAMENKRRSKVRKAERNGVVVEDLDAEEGIAQLRRLQGASGKRIVARGGRDITYKGGQPVDPLKTLLNSELGRIVGAKVDGKIESAGLFTHFNGLVYHALSGHSEAALRVQAPTYLLWETIKWYKAQQARRFNFGGCKVSAVNEGDPEHGVYVYKMGFGPRRLECTSGHKILRKSAYRAVRCLRKVLGRR